MVFSVLLLHKFLENFMFQDLERPIKWKSSLVAYRAWSKNIFIAKTLNQSVPCQVTYLSFNVRILQHEKDLLLNNLLYLVPSNAEIKWIM